MGDRIELPTGKYAEISYTRGPVHCDGWFRGDYWIVDEKHRTGMYTRDELTARLNNPDYPVTDFEVVAEGPMKENKQ